METDSATPITTPWLRRVLFDCTKCILKNVQSATKSKKHCRNIRPVLRGIFIGFIFQYKHIYLWK